MRIPPNRDGRQQVTRIPSIDRKQLWSGEWIKLSNFDQNDPDSGKVRQIKSMSCTITSPNQQYAVWRIHLHNRRCFEWHLVERFATDAEIARERTRKAA